MRSALRAGIVVLACTPVFGCVVGVDSQGQIVREEKRFKVDGAPDLRLTTFDGAIEVRGTDGSEVLVEIEKRGPKQPTPFLDSRRVDSAPLPQAAARCGTRPSCARAAAGS